MVTMSGDRRPCAKCPWVVRDGEFGFGGPDAVRHFVGPALAGVHHRCHMQPQQVIVCEGSRLFATREVRGDADSPVPIWDRGQLIETAYRLRREGRLG